MKYSKRMLNFNQNPPLSIKTTPFKSEHNLFSYLIAALNISIKNSYTLIRIFEIQKNM